MEFLKKINKTKQKELRAGQTTRQLTCIRRESLSGIRERQDEASK